MDAFSPSSSFSRTPKSSMGLGHFPRLPTLGSAPVIGGQGSTGLPPAPRLGRGCLPAAAPPRRGRPWALPSRSLVVRGEMNEGQPDISGQMEGSWSLREMPGFFAQVSSRC